jgi:hypothetical protein
VATYLERARLLESLGWGAGYRAGLTLPRLGASQRHSLRLEAQSIGPYVYRHHVFATGSAVRRVLLGSPLGPDGRGVSVRYGYHPAGSGWSVTGRLAVEGLGGDSYEDQAGPPPRLVKVIDLPNERRVRLEGQWRRQTGDGTRGLEIAAGLERVGNVGFAAGAGRTDGVVLIRLWRAFR